MRRDIYAPFRIVAFSGALLTAGAALASSGTTVSGEIATQSWTAAAGPYRIVGAITIPAGNTLTIEPGVDVLFDADVPFRVDGALRAIGTSGDSIRFLPGDATAWNGIRISGGDTSTIAYARVEGARSAVDESGGAFHIANGPRVRIDACTVRGNVASRDGGGVYAHNASVTITGCRIVGNVAGNTAGGIAIVSGASALIERCVIAGNSAQAAGGIELSSAAAVAIHGCTIADNAGTVAGGLRVRYSVVPAIRNTIIHGNAGASIDAAAEVAVAWSDVEGGYPGTGNIDADPLFSAHPDSAWHLTGASPCVNAGNPSSPIDPDGTRADIGAIPFFASSQDLLLSEDFEDGTIDPRIAVEVIGGYYDPPGIKDVGDFGSAKAFGFGRSHCSASCFEPYTVRLVIAFARPVHVYALRFREKERYSNWGSQGRILIDGAAESGMAFGREPTNDWTADTEYRTRAFVINRAVTAIAIEVWDITSSSELVIDDLAISYAMPLGSAVSGIVGTATWTKADAPYRVTGAVTVPAGDVLTIEPGVDVLFDADTEFRVEGALRAMGTALDSIRFLPGEASEWGGIRFVGGDSSAIAWARVSGARAPGGAISAASSVLRLERAVIASNRSTTDGGGMAAYESRTILDSCTVRGNVAAQSGGGIYANGGTIELRSCAVLGNVSGGGGGGMWIGYGSVIAVDCIIQGNTSGWVGGVDLTIGGRGDFARCVIAENTGTGYVGGFVAYSNNGASLANCTVTGNRTDGTAGGILAQYASIALRNTIAWGNDHADAATSGGSIAATFCDIEGGWPGTGNVDAAPLFVDAPVGDYRLQGNSPCVDAGDPESPFDADGTRADIGAYPHPQEIANALALPDIARPPGEIVVAVRATTNAAENVDLAFLVDADILEPGTALLRRHAWEDDPGATFATNVRGDTVFATFAATVSKTLSDTILAEFVFRTRNSLPEGGTLTFPLAWIPWRQTNVNELAASLVSGSFRLRRAPVWTRKSDTMTREGMRISFTVAARDPDGDPITYSPVRLPDGATFEPSIRTFAWTPDYGQAGTASVVLSAADADSAALDTIVVTIVDFNRAPVWAARSDTTARGGYPLAFTVAAVDPDGDSLAYDAPILPPGAVFDPSSRRFSWTPSAGQSGVATAVFTAFDGTTAVPDTVLIALLLANRPPAWIPRPDTKAYAGSALAFAVAATDPDGDTLVYAALVLPEGASFDAETRMFSWTPRADQIGDAVAVFSAADGDTSVAETVRISVRIRWGDVTRDDAVSALDASWILQHVVKIRAVIDTALADVSGNGQVSAYDAAWVLGKAVGAVDRFPVEGGVLPRQASSSPRTLAWNRSVSGWALIIDDPTDVRAGEFMLVLPDAFPAVVTGDEHLCFRQDGRFLRVAFARAGAGGPLLFRLESSDPKETPRVAAISLNEGAILVEPIARPPDFFLSANAPNPFNPSTTIRFGMPAAGQVELAIYDASGRLVRTLFYGEAVAGAHAVAWDGGDATGTQVASGVYVYRLASAHGTLVRRMTLIR